MRVRILGWVALALMISVGMSVAARAADSGPSQRTLEQMGLAGMSVISDDAGLSVRGFGYTGAAGFSFASIATKNGSASSTNGYNTQGYYFSAGDNYSEAGVKIKKSGGSSSHDSYGGGGKGKSITAFSGGGSSGKK